MKKTSRNTRRRCDTGMDTSLSGHAAGRTQTGGRLRNGDRPCRAFIYGLCQRAHSHLSAGHVGPGMFIVVFILMFLCWLGVIADVVLR